MPRPGDHHLASADTIGSRARISRAHLGPAWRAERDDRVRRRLAGCTVLVTGASSGIGRATSLALGRAGAHVVGLARRPDALAELADDLAAAGADSTMVHCDLREPEQVGLALETLSPLDLDTVISNAGLSIHRAVADSTVRDDLRRSAGTNLLGPAQLITGLLPGLRARGRGQVINIGSVSAVVPTAGWASYAATKAGFDAWLRALSGELHGTGVVVTTIHLPLVRTPMVAAGRRTRWALTADQAASVVLAATVRQPRSLVPWWARIAGVAGILAPASIEVWNGRR